jgi:hypothetical protein
MITEHAGFCLLFTYSQPLYLKGKGKVRPMTGHEGPEVE